MRSPNLDEERSAMVSPDPEVKRRQWSAERVAEERFENLAVARHWLELELDDLNGRRPLDVAAEDEEGLFCVIQLLAPPNPDGYYVPTEAEAKSFASFADRIPIVAPSRAPEDFTPALIPPKSPLVEWWWILDFPESECQALRGLVLGHPHLGHSAKFRSSALIWYDEKVGFARTQTRFYRLGIRAWGPGTSPY
jgi:hypothetical protein